MKWPAVVITACLILAASAPGAEAHVYVVDGAHIQVSSKRYGTAEMDPIVEIIATLPHGRELSKLQVYVASEAEVTQICGHGADACYSDWANRMIIPPEFHDGSTMPEVVAHEYGHHLENHRPGGAFGTPRWDIHEHVCDLINEGKLNAGYGAYERSPIEAFAQSYAALVDSEVVEGWYLTDWLAPTPSALARIRLDIENPWPARYAHARLRRSCHGRWSPYGY